MPVETELAQQFAKLLSEIWQLGIVIFLIILFKDFLSNFALNAFVYIQMRIDTCTYSAEGGVVMFGDQPYLIVKITFGFIIFKSMNGENCRIRMRTSDYWKGVIKYKGVENIERDILKTKEGYSEIK